jgi:hypothetical protein
MYRMTTSPYRHVTLPYRSDDNSSMVLNLSDYLITPRDAILWVRALRLRDFLGMTVMVIAAFIIGLWLQDISAALFAAGMAAAIWWRIDSRWAFGSAIVLLVLIPIMQVAYNNNWLFSGASIASGLAVTVWYLLAIGVVRQLIELRRLPATVGSVVPKLPVTEAPELKQVSPKPPIPVAPRAHNTTEPAKPVLVPAWRKRLDMLEQEEPKMIRRRPPIDGMRAKRKR